METYRHDNIEITTGAKHPIKSWTVGVEFEEHAKKQLENVANLPFIYKHVAVMPDVHAGKGCTVGSVIATQGAICASFVGVDIGCGMCAVKTTLHRDMLPNDLAPVRKAIEEAVPFGFSPGRDCGSWGNTPAEVNIAWMELEPGYRNIVSKHGKTSHKDPENQLGTLGGGNHFISINYDENDSIWLMLHSGSRGPGNRIATYFIDASKRMMKQYFIELPDMELAYLPEDTQLFDDYINAVNWCQRYAMVNRELMVDLAFKALKKSKLVPKFDFGEAIATPKSPAVINCHHNYVTRENHFKHNVLVTRKGAISARKGQAGIIPGCMGGKSYIVSGLGNPESFMSASHGAGRRMSRTQAKAQFTLKDHREATEGVECRKDSSVLDETPGAYKSLDSVIEAEKDLVEVVHTLQEVVSIKG